MFDDKTGTGTSSVFAAHWYPCVTVQINRTGGSAHSAQLQGSMDGVSWADVGSPITGQFGNNVVSNGNVWFLKWRLNLTSNDGTINAWIGAGGA